MRRLLVGLAIAGLLASASHAQNKTKPPAKWQKEPTTVLGLQLGTPLPADEPRPCGGVQIATTPAALGFCVLDEQRRTHMPISGFAISAFEKGLLTVRGGIAESIYVTAQQQNYADIRAILVERYGPPTTKVSKTVQSKAGASFSSESLTWRGARITITADERIGRVDESGIMFTTNDALHNSEREGDAATRRDAGRL